MKLRAEVQAFADMMERKLRANDHKSSKGLTDSEYLKNRLAEEAGELHVAMVGDSSALEVFQEAADVANFALFYAMLAAKQAGDSLDQLLAIDHLAIDNPKEYGEPATE